MSTQVKEEKVELKVVKPEIMTEIVFPRDKSGCLSLSSSIEVGLKAINKVFNVKVSGHMKFMGLGNPDEWTVEIDNPEEKAFKDFGFELDFSDLKDLFTKEYDKTKELYNNERAKRVKEAYKKSWIHETKLDINEIIRSKALDMKVEVSEEGKDHRVIINYKGMEIPLSYEEHMVFTRYSFRGSSAGMKYAFDWEYKTKRYTKLETAINKIVEFIDSKVSLKNAKIKSEEDNAKRLKETKKELEKVLGIDVEASIETKWRPRHFGRGNGYSYKVNEYKININSQKILVGLGDSSEEKTYSVGTFIGLSAKKAKALVDLMK